MNPPHERSGRPSPSAERALLLGIWAVIAIVGAIWKFWPSEAQPQVMSTTPIRLGRELTSWFSGGAVSQKLGTHYVVRLPLLPAYRGSIREPRVIHLGYGFRGENRVLFSGSAPCLIDGSESATIDLPNPDRVSARDIELYLAR